MSEWFTIEEVIERLRSREPDKAAFDARMAKARRELAPILYPDGGPHYERMMRGESPRPPGSATVSEEPISPPQR